MIENFFLCAKLVIILLIITYLHISVYEVAERARTFLPYHSILHIFKIFKKKIKYLYS